MTFIAHPIAPFGVFSVDPRVVLVMGYMAEFRFHNPIYNSAVSKGTLYKALTRNRMVMLKYKKNQDSKALSPRPLENAPKTYNAK